MSNIKETFLLGERILLRPLVIGDIEGPYLAWLNDPEIVKYNSHGRFPKTRNKLTTYINEIEKSQNVLVLAVVDKENNKHIGNISLQNINWIDRNAEIAFLLGEKEYQGKGIMLEAGKILINHAFKALNLHRVYCGTSSENIGMQKLAEKLGMKLEGRRKEALFKDANYFDILEYGIIYIK